MNDIDHLDKRIESLVFRVTALEKAHKYASPAPPAPLVERICLIFHKQQSPTYPARCEMAKEALLAAAEELLKPTTFAEQDDFDHSPKGPIRAIDDLLRDRLARAKEAAK